MFAYLSRRGTRPRTATRLRRITAALATVTGGLLAWAAAVPAASAATSLIPDPGGASGTVPATAPAVPVQVIAAGGMPGWQITLIAVAAVLLAAALAVSIYRIRAVRRRVTASAA
jgi:glucose/arabinose dehydrogenase